MRSKLFLFVILAVLVLGGWAIAWWYQDGARMRVPGADEYVLILGLDEVGEGRRSDTILIAKLEEGAVKVLFIPRDLQVKFPDGQLRKINAAYGQGGVELARRMVSELLGLPIYRYAVVNYQGFRQLIDALGGVMVNLERPLRYSDTKQNLNINLAAGTQTLMGAQALDFWRYRDDVTGDLGRIGRQREFLRALAQKLTQVRDPAQIKQLVETTLKNVQTNLAAVDLYRVVDRLKSLKPEALKTAVLPGQTVAIDGISYFRAEPVETAALVEEFFHGREVLTNRDVRVIVLNGYPDEVKRQGLARRASERLSAQGFQIVAYWNADTFDYPQSFLINMSGDAGKAQRLANALKGPAQIMTPEEFVAWTQERFKEDRLSMIKTLLRTTAIPPDNRGIELNEADVVLILGDGFSTGGE